MRTRLLILALALGGCVPPGLVRPEPAYPRAMIIPQPEDQVSLAERLELSSNGGSTTSTAPAAREPKIRTGGSSPPLPIISPVCCHLAIVVGQPLRGDAQNVGIEAAPNQLAVVAKSSKILSR